MRARPASLPAPAVWTFFLVGFLASSVAVAAQQQVRGTVLDADSREPVAGAMVVLLDADERPVGRVLTSADGSYQVAVPAPGRHRLRLDRIGYASTLGPLFDVAAGETVERDVVARVRPVELRGLEAEGARRCQVRPAEGLATARVWEEARKALAAAQWTAERELYRFSWERYVRDVAPDGERILSEERTSHRRFTSQPFEAADTRLLAREGFVRRDGDEVVYYAPDARVL
ncbi:MAG TPA: carboxypeptidase-like regulatory domain-containing protein, partial [Longimicrobiales bacterium]|nr:carboxypeptidase-like regulatory domain-containing protein [Longimicrobiales bacterium]